MNTKNGGAVKVLESKETRVTQQLNESATSAGFESFNHFMECFDYLGATYDGYGILDRFTLDALHSLLAEHSARQLDDQMVNVREAFFAKQKGENAKPRFKLSLEGQAAIALHQIRFLAGHCISEKRWTEFTVALAWIDGWNSQNLVGKGLLSRLDIIRYGKYADPTLLATIQKIIDTAKNSKASKLVKAEKEIDNLLTENNIGKDSFASFTYRNGLSKSTMQVYLACRPREEFEFEFAKVMAQFREEYSQALVTRGVKAAFDLWGFYGSFKKHDLSKTKDLLASLHKALPTFGRELDDEFRQLKAGDDLGFEMFIAKVARSHKALIELPKKEALQRKVEAEQLRVEALREFYKSENAMRFTARYDIEDKNPTQDI